MKRAIIVVSLGAMSSVASIACGLSTYRIGATLLCFIAYYGVAFLIDPLGSPWKEGPLTRFSMWGLIYFSCVTPGYILSLLFFPEYDATDLDHRGALATFWDGLLVSVPGCFVFGVLLFASAIAKSRRRS